MKAVACTDFLNGRSENKGTLAYVLASKKAFLPPKRAVYHVLTSQGGSLVCFANQDGTLVCFGSQEGTLACVWFPGGHFSMRLVPRRAL